jgi:hypothetical protein
MLAIIHSEKKMKTPYYRVKSFHKTYVGGIDGKTRKSDIVNFDQSHLDHIGSTSQLDADGIPIDDAIEYCRSMNIKHKGTTLVHSIPFVSQWKLD